MILNIVMMYELWDFKTRDNYNSSFLSYTYLYSKGTKVQRRPSLGAKY
jgi:uncharacterized membrane protein